MSAPFYTCPVNAEHVRFFARFQESICAFIEPDGDRGEDISNSYEGEGQKSETWCWDCDNEGRTTVAREPDAPAPAAFSSVLDNAKTIESNEDRADVAETLLTQFFRFNWLDGELDDAHLEANRFDWVGDFLADVAHYCERYGIDPEKMFARGLQSHRDDKGNDPAFAEFAPVKVLKPRAEYERAVREYGASSLEAMAQAGLEEARRREGR